MSGAASGSSRSGATAGMLLAGAVCLLALPSAVLAITARYEPDPLAQNLGEAVASSEEKSSQLALSRPIPVRSLAKGQLFPFTPASTSNSQERSITVAVRVNSGEVRQISAKPLGKTKTGEDEALRIAPTAFNLGVARGYRNFSSELVAPKSDRGSRLPDYARFSIAPGNDSDPSRFSPRIVIDEKQRAGQAPRTFAGDRQDQVDVGGSYRVSKNLDVTAGVRYAEERDRLLPLTDGKLDNQAVYVGTQIRF
jgi:hypothetical protein